MGRQFLGTRNRKDLIKSLSDKHMLMGREMILKGLTPTDLAKQFSLSRTQVSRIINSPVFLKFKSFLKFELWSEIKDLNQRRILYSTKQALIVLNEILESDKVDLKLKAKTAFWIIDLAMANTPKKNIDLPEKPDINSMTSEELRDHVAMLIKHSRAV